MLISASDIIQVADQEAQTLQTRVLERNKTKEDSFVLCQSDHELGAWLAQWSLSNQDDAGHLLMNAFDKRSQLDKRRARGVHKVATSTQRFLSQMGELSQSYSGLVDAIGGAAGPYGQAANAGYRALSCLFFVAMNKTGNEDLITSRLEEINRFFPRVNTMKAIYQEDTRIGILVALIHLDVVRFADKAAQFFSNPWRRALDLFIPPSFKIDPTYESMKTRLVELRSWASLNLHKNAERTRKAAEVLSEEAAVARGKLREVLLQQNEASGTLATTQLQVQQASQQLEEIRAIIRRQEEENQKQLLRALKESLHMRDINIKFEVEECSQSVLKFADLLHFPRQASPESIFMARTTLQQQDCYKKWASSKTPILVIGGMTHRDLSGFAWTSPAVIDLAMEWHRSSDHKLAFFSGHPRGFEHSSQRASFVTMLLGLVLQVAAQVPSILRDDLVQESTKTLLDDCNRWWLLGDMRSLARPVGRIFDMASQSHNLFIAADRLDTVEEAAERFSEMFRCFDILVRQAPKVKILVSLSVTDGRKALESQLEALSENVAFDIRLDSSFY